MWEIDACSLNYVTVCEGVVSKRTSCKSTQWDASTQESEVKSQDRLHSHHNLAHSSRENLLKDANLILGK
jgi:hypothetical protein